MEVQRDKKIFDRYKATKGETRDKISVLPDLELEIECYATSMSFLEQADLIHGWIIFYVC